VAVYFLTNIMPDLTKTMVYPIETFKDTGSATQNVKGDRLIVRYQNDGLSDKNFLKDTGSATQNVKGDRLIVRYQNDEECLC
jgi:hypothetical protein